MTSFPRIKYRPLLYALFLSLAAVQTYAGQVPPSNIIISFGTSLITLKPVTDSAVHGFSMRSPGLYIKVSGENYKDRHTFVHVDLNMSLNNGTMDNGTVKESRLCFNYGFGKCYDRVKLELTPGLCYSAIAYENKLLGRSLSEGRFAPALAVQTDLILMRSRYRYLAIFVEASAMLTKPSQWVQQLAFGINWKPDFRKEPRKVVLPNGTSG